MSATEVSMQNSDVATAAAQIEIASSDLNQLSEETRLEMFEFIDTIRAA